MNIDITLRVSPKMVADAKGYEKMVFTGQIVTKFDVINKVFPLEYIERDGIVFDVSACGQGEIGVADIDLSLVHENMFVALYSSFIEEVGYGGQLYFTAHPYLSMELIDTLISKRVSIIGVDFAGIRRGVEHPKADQSCADHDVFVVENLCNLSSLLKGRPYERFLAKTYPMNFSDMTGLPCRVIAEIPHLAMA